jgi:uncharacterized protein
MEIPFQISTGIGLVLCALVVGQAALWSSFKWRSLRGERRRFLEDQQLLRKSLPKLQTGNPGKAQQQFGSSLKQSGESLFNEGHGLIQNQISWRGYRDFFVRRLVKENESVTSVYLVASDGKPIACFHPGQHLTLRLLIPGQTRPLIRCYSLSDSPEKSNLRSDGAGTPYYRISVKEVPAPPERPEQGFGKASHFVHRTLAAGQRVEAKAPAGEFFLKEDSQRLVVLLAGGVGITPMISMLNHLVDTKADRTVLLVYGVRNGQDHPFKQHLRELADTYENIHVVNCYSRPLSTDHLGGDYHVKGKVTPALLKKILPQPDAAFYLCGPPPFMQSLYDGLLDWGVAPGDIHYEVFGPASIQRPSSSGAPSLETKDVMPVSIKFARSKVTAVWDGQQTLLEMAEAHQIPVDSGCRAGNCGTCCVAMISGQVEYPAGQKVECPVGHCLLCVAKPVEAIELDV